MNYLKQILAFYDSLELNPLNSSEIALWHALMSINNKSAWSTTFTVASSVLCLRSGLKQANFFKTRNTLQQKGFIVWESRGGNVAAKYQIKVLYHDVSTNSVDSSRDNKPLSTYSVGTSRDSRIDSSRDNSIGSSRALNKHKLKQNKKETSNSNNDDDERKSLFEFYQQEIGVLSPLVNQELDYSIQDFIDEGTSEQESIEIIKLAITRSVENNARSWKYTKAILSDWLKHSLFTLENIKASQNQRDGYSNQSQNYDIAGDELPY